MLERFKKSDVNLVQANISQSSFSKPSDGGRGGFNGHRGRGSRDFRGGRQSWTNSNRLQCQLCGKFEHLVWQYFFIFDPTF